MSEGSSDDQVGYGKPPRHSRFRKGQAGNPKFECEGLRPPGELRGGFFVCRMIRAQRPVSPAAPRP
jgi:hypothetical protein